jgi:hypothetical protein
MRLAAVVTDDLLGELKRAELPADGWRWIAASLAVGDGFDVGAIVGLAGPAEARDLVAAAKRSLGELAARPIVRLLGLRQLLDPVVLVARAAEVHLAYRVAEERLDGVLARIEGFAGGTRP